MERAAMQEGGSSSIEKEIKKLKEMKSQIELNKIKLEEGCKTVMQAIENFEKDLVRKIKEAVEELREDLEEKRKIKERKIRDQENNIDLIIQNKMNSLKSSEEGIKFDEYHKTMQDDQIYYSIEDGSIEFIPEEGFMKPNLKIGTIHNDVLSNPHYFTIKLLKGNNKQIEIELHTDNHKGDVALLEAEWKEYNSPIAEKLQIQKISNQTGKIRVRCIKGPGQITVTLKGQHVINSPLSIEKLNTTTATWDKTHNLSSISLSEQDKLAQNKGGGIWRLIMSNTKIEAGCAADEEFSCQIQIVKTSHFCLMFGVVDESVDCKKENIYNSLRAAVLNVCNNCVWGHGFYAEDLNRPLLKWVEGDIVGLSFHNGILSFFKNGDKEAQFPIQLAIQFRTYRFAAFLYSKDDQVRMIE